MSARLVQESLPFERLVTLSNPIQDKSANDKARQLLRSILPENMWSEFEETGVIQFTEKRGTYVISPHSQTEIRDSASGRCVGYACLQLSIPAPTYDRIVAEYLLIRNAEDVYWKTANIFAPSANKGGIAIWFFIAFDIGAFLNLLLELSLFGRFGS
jgi:hypothetical protein